MRSAAAASKKRSPRRGVGLGGSGGWSGTLLAALLAPAVGDDASFVGEVADGRGDKKARRKQSAQAKPATKGSKAAKGTKGTKGSKATKSSKVGKPAKGDTDATEAKIATKTATKTSRISKKGKNGTQQPTAVGRGRLPSVDTDKKYLEAVKVHGKDFVGIGSHINKTPEAAKKYWDRHRDRLGLEKDVAADAGDGANPSLEVAMEVDAKFARDANPEAATCVDSGTVLGARPNSSPQLELDDSNVSNASLNGKKRERDRPVWSDADKKAMYDAYAVHGRDWQKLHEAVGPTKTLTQVKNYYQNYRSKFVTPMGAPEMGKKPKKS
jgi:hypothetical protein